MLITCDPRAIQYIFQGSQYRFRKATDTIQATRNIFGEGLVSVEGKYSSCVAGPKCRGSLSFSAIRYPASATEENYDTSVLGYTDEVFPSVFP